MVLLNAREAQLYASKKKTGRGAEGKREAAELFHQAREAAADGKHDQAALCYAVLARLSSSNAQLALRAARSYQEAGQRRDAARWYLETAERYAEQCQTTQAIAVLRLYRELAPDEYDGPRKVFNVCQERGMTGSGLFEFLLPVDRARLSLRTDDMFAAFDDATFETALDAMVSRDLAKGDMLTRTGEAAHSLFIIVHGRVDGYLTLAGKRTHLGHMGSGEICSAVPYFTGGRCASEVTAAEETQVLELPYSVLDTLRERSEEFSAHLEALYRRHILVKQLALAPVLRLLDAETRKMMVEKMEAVSLKAGALLFRENEIGCDLYLIRSGAIGLNLDVNGEERQFKTMCTGTVVGEISISTRGRRTATARAISDCRLLKLDGEIYRQLFEQSDLLHSELDKRRIKQVNEAREFVRQLNLTEGDDTCELLLKDIWRD
ncbi:cyclic nucleotide-binding domain-containing protein [Mariprofundus ferrooxydans]|uniref:Cyclic nucleotide-binding:ABC transporter, transmembrane region:ABC transporter related:Peptidase C39, bacteriocin n=1 Tax=Mariprofundus ferrooxydans PV-1 TaxID=314345 RepID=Q0EXE4_9PROT|nr:cyclic nucleotide-binding domain-containing protein [Mariprofundus ferrooxydans]EAU53972.1 Cyclic nucleotide-binding:ABC transporter, transmembrane region:ABC transporter related:Peptidase C39, bacteriocin [Mariprofundus ferrooxydans PV-1]KON47081.1 bacteriocin ABC transporter permease [Mariprofundus ferrooxydans]